jgi:hypothetical protein
MGQALRGRVFDRLLPIVPPMPVDGWRAFVAILVFLSFFAQSYVAQTHIHYSAPSASLGNPATTSWSAPVGMNAADTARTSHHVPVPSDPSDCPLCQAVAHAGAFFAPAVIFSFLVAEAFDFTVFPPSQHVVRLLPVTNARPRAPPVS